MAFRLIPRQLKFFDLFDEAAAVTSRAADRLLALVTEFDRLAERAYEIREDEHVSDELSARILTAVEQSFLTPFDREDIHAVAQAVRDLVDAVEESAARFEVFNVERPTPSSVLLARVLRDCCYHVADALRLCRDMKNAEPIRRNLAEVSRLEQEGDRLTRENDRALFANPPTNAVDLIKWRELFASLRDAINSCRRVAQAVSTIVVKGT